jgi:hypothetical protein
MKRYTKEMSPCLPWRYLQSTYTRTDIYEIDLRFEYVARRVPVSCVSCLADRPLGSLELMDLGVRLVLPDSYG